MLYAPDFCVNAGGLIQVADELHGFSMERPERRPRGIYDTTKAVLAAAARRQVTPDEAANQLAERPHAQTSLGCTTSG